MTAAILDLYSFQCYQVTQEDARKISGQSVKQFSRYVHFGRAK